jgi:hypothetical protein
MEVVEMNLVQARGRTIQFCFSLFYSEEFSLRKFQYRLLRHLYKSFHVLTYYVYGVYVSKYRMFCVTPFPDEDGIPCFVGQDLGVWTLHTDHRLVLER